MRPYFTLLIPLCLAACSQFPELDASVSDSVREARYPDLVPLAQLDVAAREGRITDETTEGTEARIAELEARADRLRGRVLDAPSRERLAQKVE
ncbi:hypothetical protein KUD11_08450 [Roseovarius sp. LXJ103]|uniref:hypothetical protein n=1 Tax=Roseovarius carneus TaxID=2853164 RepID=UPI000D619CBD|nr:hypothetical protein [Roseovarius carneus]MBZ8118678.1 hypothetical protein [Roseovarius carneus]PWE35640.1 hypothetical protein DD563_06510 [Pelagicola sp. LXJ1103]